MLNKIRIGLALGGGGAKGLAHIGVLKVLEREGIKIDYLAGTSAGAVAAVCWALGKSIAELEKSAEWIATPINWGRLFSFGDITKAVVGNSDFLKYLQELFNNADFADLKIPTKIVATDLANGTEVLIDHGALAKAVLASSSIPGLLPPVVVNGRYLVDGGIANQTPVSVVEAMGADVIIAVDLMLDDGREMDNPNLIESLTQAYELIRKQSVRYSLEKTKANYILIQPEFKDLADTFKFDEAKKFIQAGELATEKVLEQIKKQVC